MVSAEEFASARTGILIRSETFRHFATAPVIFCAQFRITEDPMRLIKFHEHLQIPGFQLVGMAALREKSIDPFDNIVVWALGLTCRSS